VSKRTDVTYGRQGGRLVPADDGRSLLEHLDDLRQQMGGSLKPETPAPADDGQLELFGADE
jgi:hypothetical protein